MRRIQIDAALQRFLVERAEDLGESPSSILRRELHLAPPADTIEIDDDVYRFLVSKAESLSESPSTILRRELALGDAPVRPPSVIEFRIRAGTANGAWNAADAPVSASVGDTLRITNDDAVSHRLHTSGVPFPHPDADIMPGQSADFVLTAPFESPPAPPLHDHAFGLAARFFLRVTAR